MRDYFSSDLGEKRGGGIMRVIGPSDMGEGGGNNGCGVSVSVYCAVKIKQYVAPSIKNIKLIKRSNGTNVTD